MLARSVLQRPGKGPCKSQLTFLTSHTCCPWQTITLFWRRLLHVSIDHNKCSRNVVEHAALSALRWVNEKLKTFSLPRKANPNSFSFSSFIFWNHGIYFCLYFGSSLFTLHSFSELPLCFCLVSLSNAFAHIPKWSESRGSFSQGHRLLTSC